MKVLLVCSPGGHLQQMLAMEPAWGGMERAWVTLAGPDVRSLLAGERVTIGHGPTNRSLLKLVRNFGLALRVLHRRRPDAILSTGAGLAVPFFAAARLFGIRCVFVESLTRTESRSVTGRLVYPLSDRFFVQWPAAARGLPRAEYVGQVL